MRQRRTKTHIVTAAASIDAAPERVYAIIADYHNGHAGILPREFSGLSVERGGVGAGTVIRFRMRVMGRTRSFRAEITEPEPGRVLVETYLDSNGAVTTFTVRPDPSGFKSEVRISTKFPVRAGLLGVIQRFLTTKYLRPIYQRELTLLTERAR
jgi:polyketide cyclase/dehydrase/lipid transport protein